MLYYTFGQKKGYNNQRSINIMAKITPIGNERIAYEGKIFEVVKQDMDVGPKVVEFEIARRAPGTRIIIVKGNQILITKEYRTELNGYDYRLPGGKVFDALKDYKNVLKDNSDLLDSAVLAAKKECLEETGLTVNKLELFKISKAGATIEWDLYYFIARDFSLNEEGQQLEDGEIIKLKWRSFDEVRQLCIDGKISEDRTLGVLLMFLENKSKI